MKNLYILAVCASVAMLTGCETTSWAKSGVTDTQRENQLAACRYNVGVSRVTEEQKAAIIRDCMTANGYRLQ